MSFNILISDDHPIFRKGLKDILENSLPEINIQECSDGQSAWDLLKKKQFDLVVLDVEMPEINGLKLCKMIHSDTEIFSCVVILTMYKNDEIFFSALDAGAEGFVLKDNSAEEIVDCIQQVLNGNIYISKEFKDKLTDYQNFKNSTSNIKKLLESLTETEIKTLFLVSQNYSSQEIAEYLFVTSKTIENYRSRICKKLGLSPGNNSLLKWALENKDMIKMMNN